MSASSVKTCGAVSVTTSNTVVLGANASRRSVTFSLGEAAGTTNVVWLAFTTAVGTAPTAVASSGVRLSDLNRCFTLSGYSGAVSAIAVGGTSVVTVLEV